MEKTKTPLLFLLLLYGLIGYSPYFGAVDQVGPQWLELTLLNIFTLIYFQFSNLLYWDDLVSSFKSKIQICLILFCLWGLISYTYAINPNEVLIKTSQWINVIMGISLVFLIIKKLDFNLYKISIFVLLLVIVEVSASIYQYLQLIEFRKYDFSLANYIKGLTGNKNITSASIATKVPFLIYLIHKTKKHLFVFIFSIILFITYFNLILLSSRAVYISLLSVNFLILLGYSILRIKKGSYEFLNPKKILLLISLFIGSILFSLMTLGKGNSALVVNRIQTINFEDESTQQRLRYYDHALTHFSNNIFFGVGLGSWKIKSIDYDSLNMNSYIVPYHVHNDFLETSAELGLIGLILLLSPFLIIPFSFLKNLESKYSFEYFIVCLSVLVYFIDSNLNFPHARVINQIVFMIIIASYLRIKTAEER